MKRLTVILNLIICFQLLNAQIDKEFWFAIPKETGSHGSLSASNNVSFKITNQSNVLPAHVEISMPANPSFNIRTIEISPSQTYTEILATNFIDFQNIYSNPSAYNVTAISGITNHGIYIKSNNDISVYYDYDNSYNRDLFTLKGKNALGTDFYTPFQNIWSNGPYAPDAPLSSANIVATEDGTTVWIYPTKILQGRSDTNPFSVTLNRGQTYTIVAKSAAAADHFSGTRIISSDPNKPIAVTINDDSVNHPTGGCKDIIGDQLVPINVVGQDYLVMTGTKSAGYNVTNTSVQDPTKAEQIVITGTQTGTQVDFYKKNGVLFYSTIINAQQTVYITPDISDPNQTSVYVHASKPVCALHITGINCEMGGAILPSLTNCTGSNEVSFYRSNIDFSNNSDITLNLMIPYDTSVPLNSPTQSHNYFTIHYQNGSTSAIPASWFEAVPIAGVVVLSSNYRGNSGMGTLIPLNQAVKIKNDKALFHLGFANGYGAITNKYGYFSNFGVSIPSASFSTNTGCFGDTVYLKASGGVEYNWHYGSPNGPATYLNDSLSSTPRAICPPGLHDFYVVIHSNCFENDTLKLSVHILPQVKAQFEIENPSKCASFQTKIRNTSLGNTYSWTYQKDNDAAISFTPSSQNNFTQPSSGYFENNTPMPITYKYRLIASYYGECADTLSKTITVYPKIKACITPSDTTINSNSIVTFRNNSVGNINSYLWNFGDGNISNLASGSHVFVNNKSVDTTFNVKLMASSNYSCHDSASARITVHPYIKANFTSDITTGCGPLSVRLIDTSNSDKSQNQSSWDFGDGTTQTNNDTVMHVFFNKTSNIINYKILLSVKTQFKTDTVSRIITVYPEVIANFTTSKENGKSPLTVTFTNESTASSYEWDFGDNTSSTLLNPTHTFVNSGQDPIDYPVFLTAKSNYNCEDTCVKFIKLLPDCRAIADFTPSIYSGQNPMTVNFVNNSSNFDTNHWDFGDNTTSIVKSPSHVFYTKNNAITEYEVKLVVSKPYCSSDSATHRIVVYPGTIANVEDLSNNTIKLFPNPAHDKFNFQYTLDKLSEVTIELFSPSGASVKKFDTIKEPQGEYQKTIDFGTYNGDLLFVKITIDGNSSILKVIHQ